MKNIGLALLMCRLNYFPVPRENINRKEAYKILAELEEKGKELPYPTKYYGLVGLDIDSREDLEKDGYLVYELKDLVKLNTYSVNLPK